MLLGEEPSGPHAVKEPRTVSPQLVVRDSTQRPKVG
jgi:LacI family transcriptional regulator